MNWDNIRYFLAVARSGSLSQAAEQLQTSHVTVARHIQRLEEQEGVKLFDRRKSGYLLTPAAEPLLQQAQAVEAQCQDFFRLMRGRTETQRGRLTVSTPENSVINLAPVFAEFSRQHSQTELVINASSVELINLEKREAEVVLRIIDTPPEHLVGRQLKTLKLRPYASQAYLDRVDIKTQGSDWILFQRHKADNQSAEHITDLPQHRIVMRSNSNAEVLAAVQAGLGIGIISDDIAKACLQLKPLFPQYAIKVKLWLLTHPDLRNATRVSQFMRFMASADT